MVTHTIESDNNGSTEAETSWVQSLSAVIRNTKSSSESRIRTALSFDMEAGKPSLFVPPDMAELQPRTLRYLRALAHSNDLKLVEDRRRIDVQPMVEQRDSSPPTIAVGLSLLLKQTGIPGEPKSLSSPHRLNADSPHVGILDLIAMAAYSTPKSKRVVVLPNKMIMGVLNNDTHPITGYACKLISSDTSTVLCHFDSPNFRAIGYSAGKQYVIHICLAGGPGHQPTLWAQQQTMSHTDFRFQLFPAKNPKDDFGLAYATFYIDLAGEKLPWWLAQESDTHIAQESDTHIKRSSKTSNHRDHRRAS